MKPQLVERAEEWIGLNYPELDGLAYELKIVEVMRELQEIDDAADAAEAV